jgi:hypothetical protein
MSDTDPVGQEVQDLMAKDRLSDAEQIRLHLLLQPTFTRPPLMPRWLWRLLRRRF